MTVPAAALHESAAAKINLALHVTGRRADGYHELDSLVVFTAAGDRLSATAGDNISLTIEGPMAAGLAREGNLVLKAAEAFSRQVNRAPSGVRLVLEKHLPVASGIGGGSADAAAALRLLNRLWRSGASIKDLARTGLALGADVPVCVHSRPARMTGIGESVSLLASLPRLPLVLVNPGCAVSTPDVFARLARRENPPLPPFPAIFSSPAEIARYLLGCRNDLEAPARAVTPVIAEIVDDLAGSPGCLIARMSGSGATCFGLYPDTGAADAAARAIAARRPGWWVTSTTTLSTGA